MNKPTPKEAIEVLRKTIIFIENASDEYWTQDEISSFGYHAGMLDCQFHIIDGDEDRFKEQVKKVLGR